MSNQEEMLRKKSFQGKVESAVWRKGATLRDILDAMDQIKVADIDPKQKAALLQRVVDYGQHLSEQIHLGKRQVSETDDNETIKEFNLRMQNSAYSKDLHKNQHREPMHGKGYYNEKEQFVEVNHPSSQGKIQSETSIRGGDTNPRWHPIPLKETTIQPTPIDPYDNITPIDPHNNTGVVTPPTPVDPYTPITPPTPTPPVTPITPTPQTPLTPEVPTTSSQTTEKKRKKWPFMLIPIIAAGILAKECQPRPVIIKDKEPEKTEQAIVVVNETENNYLNYTVQKGKGMLNKQGVENADAVYDNFVNNFDKIPQELKDLVEKYNMGTAKDASIGIDITDNAQVVATTLILMAESYPNIAPIIHNQMKNPGSEISPSESSSLNVRCKMAEHAHKKHGGDDNGNHLATSDYGLYGASSKTGPSVKFSSQEKTVHYNDVVTGVFKKGETHNY